MRSTLLCALAALAIASTAHADEPAGRQFALLVGVQDYTGTQLANLRHADNDVTKLAEVLRAKGSYHRVTLMTQPAAFDGKDRSLFPSADNVRAHLTALLADRQPGDTVLVAFAGHGVVLKGATELFFCPLGADLTRPKDTLVSLTEVYAALKECKAGVRLLLVDACRNELAVSRTGRPNVDLQSETRPELPKPPQGVAALFSCSAGEVAFESRKHPHGVFFYHLLQGLNGKAANARGHVLLESLVGYVKGEMADTLLAEFGPSVRQRPHLLSDVSGAVVVLQPMAVVDLVAEGKRYLGTNVLDEDGNPVYKPERAAKGIDLFTQAIRLNPRNAEAFFGRGQAHAQRRELDQAITDFTEALRLDPNNANAFEGRGDAYRKKRDFDRAITDYSETVRIRPKDEGAWHKVMGLCLEEGKYELAVIKITEYLRLWPKDAGWLSLRGVVCAELGRKSDALIDLNEAIRLGPNAATYHNRGLFFRNQGDNVRAIADFTAAIQHDRRSHIPRYQRGICYAAKKDFDQAIADFNEVILLKSTFGDAYLSRGLAFKAKGNSTRAAADFAKYKELTGKDP